jgi:hypothetical protein
MENMKGVDDKDLDWRFKQASEAKSDYVHKKRKIKLVKSFLLKPKIYTFMIKLLLFKMPKC